MFRSRSYACEDMTLAQDPVSSTAMSEQNEDGMPAFRKIQSGRPVVAGPSGFSMDETWRSAWLYASRGRFVMLRSRSGACTLGKNDKDKGLRSNVTESGPDGVFSSGQVTAEVNTRDGPLVIGGMLLPLGIAWLWRYKSWGR